MYFEADLPWEPLEQRVAPPWRRGPGPWGSYNEAIGRAICERVAAGWSVRRICRHPDMPNVETFYKWKKAEAGFAADYRAAVLKARAGDREHDMDKRRGRGGKVRTRLGAKSTYTMGLAQTICERIAGGESLIAICRAPGMAKYGTVCGWLRMHADFADAYAVARLAGADFKNELMWEIAKRATPETVAVAALQIRTLQWQITREAPHKYCERLARRRVEEAEGDPGFDFEAFATWRYGGWDEAKARGLIFYQNGKLHVLPAAAAGTAIASRKGTVERRAPDD